MVNASAHRDANVAAHANVAALTERDAAESFSAQVIEFSAADLAVAARRTKSAAKGWKDASRCPGLASAINMARALPSVRDWMIEEMGCGRRDSDAASDEAIARIVRHQALGEGPEAAICRAILRQAELRPVAADVHDLKKPAAPSIERQIDLFAARAEKRRA